VASVTVKNQGAEHVALTGYQSGLAGLTLKLPPEPIQPGKSAQIVAEFNPRVANPYLSDAVTVKTTSKREPDIFIRVFGSVREFKFR
jgi:hypothetical protein